MDMLSLGQHSALAADQFRKLFAQRCRVITALTAYIAMEPGLPHRARQLLTLQERSAAL